MDGSHDSFVPESIYMLICSQIFPDAVSHCSRSRRSSSKKNWCEDRSRKLVQGSVQGGWFPDFQHNTEHGSLARVALCLSKNKKKNEFCERHVILAWRNVTANSVATVPVSCNCNAQ